ncbi:RanBP2-type domain-containing protein [Caenorhabditis elegans]|uniref:RanBP2-type domain-containing protein n=1 Tax=Caenorhabditis elegans TaxID=6239 RepID=G5ED12_CAEEL|nr:RanBP2-type domain-containing protein [Caenorhabditis elegans]CBZ42129.1 RanBP2-type domain-containing protein [Caenorhabditis elegans]|eukprot:NP_001256152.1 CaLPain family [Caenorhabditis elegans]
MEMTAWNCLYCTLINDPAIFICQGCGSQKPLTKKPAKLTGSFPKIITDTVRDVSNAISDLVNNRDRSPAHNFVRATHFRTPLPNGPFVDGQSNDPRVLYKCNISVA